MIAALAARRADLARAAADLANVAWRCLDGAHRRFSLGGATARRYAPGFAPIAAVADPLRPDLAALRALAAPGESLYLAGVDARAWNGFELVHETEVEQMAWLPAAPEDGSAGLRPRALTAADRPAMLRLVEAARPGPFGPRAVELGRYAGVFERRRLVAMAGTRMRAGRWLELSAVCTDPAHARRGLAAALVRHLQRAAVAQRRCLFLHVEVDNVAAASLYRKLGFVPLSRQRLRRLRRTAD